MKIHSIEGRVAETAARMTAGRVHDLEARVRGKKPQDLVGADRMSLRRERLSEADFRPSQTDRERILGTNDLVDVNYLARAQLAAKSVCRIILRDPQGREIGYGSGFKVAPNVIMTNQHVLQDSASAALAVAEFGYELDLAGRPSPTTRFRLDPGALFFNDERLDFAIVAIDDAPFSGAVPLDAFGFLRMQPETGKVNPGEFVTIIQHPAGQPKQIALRENQVLSIEEHMLWYQSDTAPGSSGSAVLNDSWQIVALHHSGVPKKDEAGRWLRRDGRPAGPDTDDADIDWIANEGIRISRIVARVREGAGNSPFVRQLDQVVTGDILPEAAFADASGSSARPVGVASRGPSSVQQVEPISGGARITVPFSFEIRLTDGAALRATPQPALAAAAPALAGAPPPAGLRAPLAPALEALRPPVLDNSYGDRSGYDAEFLGISLALPKLREKERVARMDDGKHELPYQHFTVVMDKTRRLALYAASNVDASVDARRPETGRDYTRRGLGGFAENDREQWVTDPRIPEQHQLPDEFYNRDRTAFDKGHLVRRDDVCFGNTYRQVQRANGDTYHTTNCTPQVSDFNRSGEGGIWGRLENEILKQAKTERYCLFAGPLLRRKDKVFEGVDRRGPVRVQIPSAFWKIVVARAGDELQAFGFLLEQDLDNVEFEFMPSAEWRREMISIPELEQRIGALEFSKELRLADQFGKRNGDEVARLTGFRAQASRSLNEALSRAAPSNGGE